MTMIDTLAKPLPRQPSRAWPKWVLVAITGVLLVDAVFGEAGYVARRRARADFARHMTELTAVRLENQALLQRRRRLQRDPSAIEETARRDLGLVKRGEVLFVIHDRTGRP